MIEGLLHVARHAPAGDPGQPPLSADSPSIHPTAGIRDARFGPWTAVGARTRVAETSMGAYSYVVQDADIIYSTIGRFCSIAAATRINPGNHPTWRASQHHFLYRASSYRLGEDEDAFFAWRREHEVTIGHDVWIGHGAVVLAGRRIGTGAVIGAGSVVTRDVAPYTIVAGNPARPIRRRFDERVAERLQALAWWDWPHERVGQALADFRSLCVEEFLERHGG
ncbi:LbetaH domain-containing protein [Marinimicrococcus flavescens]|uniref:Chloramphenicol acetyltransferase n=1 Tax=Marinimicrococcus flavescens TaxID=3031815 RepID=A0AAP3UZP4_9PROT|nr:chloramphenicol acetyltransferase [Marinimicrococcus flavescens]